MIKTITLSPEDIQKFTQIDSSIQHWSVEHTKMTLTVKQIENNVHNLYDARNQLITRIQHDAGINANMIEKTVLSPGENDSSAVMTVHLQDPESPSTSES